MPLDRLANSGLHGGRFASQSAAVRTLILILICTAFVVGGIMDAKSEQKGERHVIRSGAIALCIGLVVCWLLVYVVGIFDGWEYSLRR